ncbi:hypothetical protein EJ110_NYTH04731 [Nymphaea thermarum]|nr:hypothetical protein EJ110_NYTH04731 [Nymphaea thermarum]
MSVILDMVFWKGIMFVLFHLKSKKGCGVKLKTYQSRQQHLIDKHKFPMSFEFLKKKHLSKQQRQHQHRRAAKKIESDATSDHAKSESAVVGMEMEGNVAELASAVSRLSTADASSPSNVMLHNELRLLELGSNCH